MKNLITILLVTTTTCLHAQKFYTIDLARDTHDRQTISLDYTGIELINKLPHEEYHVTIEVELESGEEEKAGAAEGFFMETCDSTLLDALYAATTEEEVASAIDELENLIRTAKDANEKVCPEHALIEAKELTREKREFYFDVEKNQNIYITVTAESSARSWKIILRTPLTVDYLSHFGFTFVPGGNQNSDRYFSKETAAGVYTITQMNNNGRDFWKDLSLTANYIIPIVNLTRNEKVRLGCNGGFGLNGQAKFTVMAGLTLLFDDFLSLNFDGGLHNRYKLKGEYMQGQQLNENLSIDQLNEQGLRPAFMFSLGFRLSKEQAQAAIENKGSKD